MKNEYLSQSLVIIFLILSNVSDAHSDGVIYQNTNATDSIELSNINDVNVNQTLITNDTQKLVSESEISKELSTNVVESSSNPSVSNDQDSQNVLSGGPIKNRTDDEVVKVMQKYRDTMVQNGNKQQIGGSSAASRRYLLVDKNSFINNFNNSH